VKTKRKLLDVVRLLTSDSLSEQPETSEHEQSYTEYMQQQKRAHDSCRQVKDGRNSIILTELQVQRKVVNERGWPNFREVFMVSALLGDGMNDIKVTARMKILFVSCSFISLFTCQISRFYLE
jgi:hypothetical protein